jgi:two-component system OmpR family response regulator
MKTSNAPIIQVALGETNPVLRSAFQSAFQRRGMRGVHVCHDGAGLKRVLDNEFIDLVVCADDLPGTDLRGLAQNIRQGQVGCNPFALMLATSRVGARYDRRRVTQSGVDQVARKPLSLSEIMALIDRMARSRQPFIATHNYVGPSRRAALRSDLSGRDQVDVPNSLRVKLLEPGAAPRLEALIDRGMSEIDLLRLNNSRMAIERASRRIARHYHDRPMASTTDLHRLRAVAQGIANRYAATPYAHFAELAACLVRLADMVSLRARANQRKTAVSLALLLHLAQVLRYMRLQDDDALHVVQDLAYKINRFLDTLG